VLVDFLSDRTQPFGEANMKATDDYQAKIRFWAADQKVIPLPDGPKVPKFAPQKFSSHEEMNRWKEALLLQMARDGHDH
jgi:hypothetical protein